MRSSSGSNGAAAEYPIYVIAAARQLTGKPHHSLTLLVQFFTKDFADGDCHAFK